MFKKNLIGIQALPHTLVLEAVNIDHKQNHASLNHFYRDSSTISFVCDGYDTDGTFHMNWGWGGFFDGFFELHALNPAILGTGSDLSEESAYIGVWLSKEENGTPVTVSYEKDLNTTLLPKLDLANGNPAEVI
jgi:hypothetical protein